jgi:hypothetical protein
LEQFEIHSLEGYESTSAPLPPKNVRASECGLQPEPRAKSLVSHSDVTVRDFAVETLKEIEMFKISEDSYGYVFYVLQRSN